MTTITVKNIPAELHKKLKRNATFDHQSLNNEIIAFLECILNATSINSKSLLASAREFCSNIS